LIEFNKTERIFTRPDEKQTEDYITVDLVKRGNMKRHLERELDRLRKKILT